jgi:PIN domain nuclease of toxin-antitoxin system
MKILLDTHTFLWFISADNQLSSKAKNIISDPNYTKYISIATFWEVTIKLSLNKLKLQVSLDALFDLKGYEHLNISIQHLLQLQNLEFHHRDPFDRIIIAQALSEKMTIISNELIFDKYKVKRIW